MNSLYAMVIKYGMDIIITYTPTGERKLFSKYLNGTMDWESGEPIRGKRKDLLNFGRQTK